MFGDPANFQNQKISEASIIVHKLVTRTILLLDEVESQGMEYRLILAIYHAVTKTLLGRSIEQPLGGLMIFKNIKPGNVMEAL